MSDTDSLDYLQSEFDPNSLTVPRLRSILVNYNINYPSTAKKTQLIEIFIDKILPQKSKILKERERARRSSKGIVNAEPRKSIEDDDIAPLPRTPRRSSRYTSSRIKDEEVIEENPLFGKEKSQSPSKRKPRVSSKHGRTSDTETGSGLDTRKRLSRRLRRSETPTHSVPEAVEIKSYLHDEPSVAEIKSNILDEPPLPEIKEQRVSSFSNDNPFQSGSSPTSGITPEKRRKSSGFPKERRKTASYTKTRKSETPKIDHGIFPPSAENFHAPITLNNSKDKEEIGIETTEEFTPEEKLELATETAANRVINSDQTRNKSRPKNRFSLKGPLWVLITSALLCYYGWYRQEKLAVGYCGFGRDATPLLSFNWQMPNWTQTLIKPECEPCPRHANCSEGMEVDCWHDFILKPHPLSLAGLVPLVPTCEPDGGKVRKVKSVSDRAIDVLRERNANYECGHPKDETGTLYSSPEIEENDLKNEVAKKRRPDMSDTSFNELWSSALPELKSSKEVQQTFNGTHEKFSSTSLAHLPLSCAFRRSIRKTLAENIFRIGGVVISILFLLYTRSVILSHRKINAIIPGLVSTTLSRLANQAALHHADTNFDRWISVGQLRDDVLRDEHSIAKRETIWRKVRIVIETNANVRSSQKEDRNGEVSRVWEWIGALEKQSRS